MLPVDVDTSRRGPGSSGAGPPPPAFFLLIAARARGGGSEALARPVAPARPAGDELEPVIVPVNATARGPCTSRPTPRPAAHASPCTSRPVAPGHGLEAHASPEAEAEAHDAGHVAHDPEPGPDQAPTRPRTEATISGGSLQP